MIRTAHDVAREDIPPAESLISSRPSISGAMRPEAPLEQVLGFPAGSLDDHFHGPPPQGRELAAGDRLLEREEKLAPALLLLGRNRIAQRLGARAGLRRVGECARGCRTRARRTNSQSSRNSSSVSPGKPTMKVVRSAIPGHGRPHALRASAGSSPGRRPRRMAARIVAGDVLERDVHVREEARLAAPSDRGPTSSSVFG